MNAMKTTNNDWKMVSAKSAQKHDSCVNFKNCATEKTDSLCWPKLPASGRSVRQIIIPAGAMKHASRAQRRGALRRLIKATKRWYKEHHSGVRCVAFSTNSGMEQMSNVEAAAASEIRKPGGIIMQ